MQKIIPHLWFDTQAKEAAAFYTKLFENSKIKSEITIHNTPSGDCDVVSVDLFNQEFMFLSAGPYFKITPAISFLITCNTAEEVNAIWKDLSVGSKALMELGEYPFAQRYGWLEDKFGVSWQIMFMEGFPVHQKITPTLMFVGDQCGNAEEAINFYTSIFKDSSIGEIMRYGKDSAPDKEGTITHAGFSLVGQQFAAMDSAQEHKFAFNEAVSFIVRCKDQAEINYFWDKLSAHPENEQCGWLKDKFGVSWQIEPTILGEMMQSKDSMKVANVTQAFLKMKKFDISKLKEAYEK